MSALSQNPALKDIPLYQLAEGDWGGAISEPPLEGMFESFGNPNLDNGRAGNP